MRVWRDELQLSVWEVGCLVQARFMRVRNNSALHLTDAAAWGVAYMFYRNFSIEIQGSARRVRLSSAPNTRQKTRLLARFALCRGVGIGLFFGVPSKA